MSARAAALLAAPLGAFAFVVAPGSGCTVSRCCGMLGSHDYGRRFHDDQVSFWHDSINFCSSGCNYSPACTLLNVVPGVEEDGGPCNSTGDGNATILDAISSDLGATSRLSSGRPLVSVFIEGGTCAGIEDGGCWSAPSPFAYSMWTNKFVGDSPEWTNSHLKHCAHGLPEQGRPAWGIGCALDGAGLRVLAWLADANASDAEASDLKASPDHVTSDASAGEDWFAQSCGLSTGLDFTIGADDWNANAAGSPRWMCFDIPRESMSADPVRMLVQSVGELPCTAASSSTGATISSTTRVHAGATALAAAATAAVAHQFL